MPQINNYRVADHDLQIIFEDSKYNSLALIDSFEPFRVEEVGQDLLFRFTIDDSLRPVPKVRRHRIRAFDTGNGDTIVDKLDDGGYQYIIKNIDGAECCLLIADKEFNDCRCALNGNFVMRDFGLNSALMLTLLDVMVVDMHSLPRAERAKAHRLAFGCDIFRIATL